MSRRVTASEAIEGSGGSIVVGGLVSGEDGQGLMAGEKSLGPIVDAGRLHPADGVVLQAIDASLADWKPGRG